MIRHLRAGVALAAVLSLTAPSFALAVGLPHLPYLGMGHRATKEEAFEKLPPGAWPQATSDVKADPDIRFGSLPNGMRYAIKRQAIPAGQAALRLRFDAGSLMETDAQQGLAHFLEHMAFNGSKNVPQGEMVKILERHGLAFGADTNASTNFDETVYKLDLPKTDDDTVDTSLKLLREAASELTIAQDAVNKERGVVLSEERSSDSPAYQVYKARMGFELPGQLMPSRLPIGKVDILQKAPASLIADFYHHYYRPERAVLVAVGDFDPAAMEAKIRARFGDWKDVGPVGPEPVLGAVKPRKTEAKLVVQPGTSLNLQVTWVRPPDLRPDRLAKRRSDVIEQLGFAVLNRRLSALARSPQPPFLGAAAFKADQGHSAEVTMLSLVAQPDGWRDALAAVDQEERRAVRYGVRQDELDREIAEERAAFQAAVSGAATRRPAQIADEIVGTLSDQDVVTSPAEDLAFFESTVKGLKADTVSAALKGSFSGQGPLVFMASPKPVQGAEPAILAEYASTLKMAVAPPAAPHAVVWPYESFGTPSKVAETKEVTDLDTVFVRFDNGVRLTVKPTKFRDDEVLVRVNIGDGLQDLPKDRQSLAWFGNAFIEGGLKKIDSEDTERVLASKVYEARFGVGEDAFVLSGSTRTADLPTQMQVLAAYVSDPGWRSEAFKRQQSVGKTAHDQMEGTDGGVMGRDLAGLLHAGDRRFTYPSRDEIAKAQLSDLQAQIAPHLADDPIEVVVVGDITVDKAIEAVDRTFGALPARRAPQPVPAAQRAIAFPAATATPLLLTHKGRDDQAIGYMAWPTNDLWANPQQALDTDMLGEVMGLRLIDELRLNQGVTYSPSVSYTHSLTWTGWGYLAASVEVPPAKLDGFFRDVSKIAADLRAKDVTPDELERAKKPRIDKIERAQVTNQYWLSELSGAQADPRRLDFIRHIIPGTQRVTADDIKHAADLVLRDDKLFKLEVEPQAVAKVATAQPAQR
ncbi:MAG TPA: insulinase family protein [Phenylobacterium sp.]|jgi:zinc protease|uniref:M16 family metallopeptidase n=1 Tax=Phenylobacterium sp. TaxID=1871053 RepID=UPI002D448421|nr:insulinase family protein [Phenylobacterium sp.]HZZ66556.1 insulinase family protein [Phenylobacterium sp.]